MRSEEQLLRQKNKTGTWQKKAILLKQLQHGEPNQGMKSQEASVKIEEEEDDEEGQREERKKGRKK
jgi:hypothetical protein